MQFTLFTHFQTSFKTFFTFRSIRTSSAFEIVGVNALYKLLTYFFT